MPISGNISSTEYAIKRTGLPVNQINVRSASLVADNKVWPCGLLLTKSAEGWKPYKASDTGIVGVLDSEVDTSKATTGLVVVFGEVRKDLLKVGLANPKEPVAADLNKLEERHIYAV